MNLCPSCNILFWKISKLQKVEVNKHILYLYSPIIKLCHIWFISYIFLNYLTIHCSIQHLFSSCFSNAFYNYSSLSPPPPTHTPSSVFKSRFVHFSLSLEESTLWSLFLAIFSWCWLLLKHPRKLSCSIYYILHLFLFVSSLLNSGWTFCSQLSRVCLL